jgi:hypothetical protein
MDRRQDCTSLDHGSIPRENPCPPASFSTFSCWLSSTAGQESQQAYQNALQAQGQAANQGLTALQNEGALAGQLYGQEAGQANTVAAAQNALNQFNAANTQQTNLANQANTQASNVYNTQNLQNLANENVSGANQAQFQNQVSAPQESAQLALEKSGQEVGVSEAQASQQTAAGQQAAGLAGGLLGAGATLGSSALAGPSTVVMAADGGEIPQPTLPATPFVRGGSVPGQAKVAGNNPGNDTVPARLSPGEFVIPRTDMQNPKVRQFLAANTHTPRPPQGAHPSDLASLLRAMSMLRGGQPA